jgi:hypothetical protein
LFCDYFCSDEVMGFISLSSLRPCPLLLYIHTDTLPLVLPHTHTHSHLYSHTQALPLYRAVASDPGSDDAREALVQAAATAAVVCSVCTVAVLT